MEINSCSQRISKIYGNRKFGTFGVVLKLELEVTTNSCLTTWVPLWGRATVWWCSITLFSPFNLSLNLPKFHLNSGLPPP